MIQKMPIWAHLHPRIERCKSERHPVEIGSSPATEGVQTPDKSSLERDHRDSDFVTFPGRCDSPISYSSPAKTAENGP